MNETSLIESSTQTSSETTLQSNSEVNITEEQAGQRIDKLLGELSPDVSRSAIQQWIKSGNVLVNGKIVKQTYKLLLNDVIEIDRPEQQSQKIEECVAEDLSIDLVYEDDDILVVNKAAGVVVHPGAGNMSGTLMNGILFRWPESRNLPRAGIVHRLDKDTSGLMVLAKNEHARLHLIEQLSQRTVSREYLAVCLGALISGSTINKAMRRDSHDRRKMTICKGHEAGKEAITHYRIEERFRRHTLVRVKLETGRTHQIRVHMTSVDFPLVGDPVYGKRLVLPKGCEPSLSELLRGFKRQALHATRLALIHPVSGEVLEWEAPMPIDMQVLTQELRADSLENQ
jgi:23S rRNA pseudouridine1911/1915/1917 synthase